MEQEMNTLDDHTRRFIASTEGFFERYVYNLAFFATNKAAYEETERQYMFVTGRRRFKNHDTFKSAYSRFNSRRAARLAKKS